MSWRKTVKMWNFNKLTQPQKDKLNRMISQQEGYNKIGLFLLEHGVTSCDTCLGLSKVKAWCDWAKENKII